MRTILVGVLVVSSGALAAPTFEEANRFLAEQSNSKACDAFEGYLKENRDGPLAREATAKRAHACWLANKRDGSSELQKLASQGEKDFARAFAQWALSTRGYTSFQQTLPLLSTATKAEGRQGAEARQLLVAGALRELDNGPWDLKWLDQLVEAVAANSTSEADKAHARFRRANVWRSHGEAHTAKAEAELTAIGQGATAWADDALEVLGNVREGQGRFVEALAFYDDVVKRFSPTTSNRHSSCRSSAENIRAPSLSVSSYQVALPGVKVPVQLSWRNLESITLTLRRADPFKPSSNDLGEQASGFLASSTVEKTWNESPEVKSKHAPGSRTLEIALPSTGLFVLEAQSRSGGLTSRELLVMSPLAIVTKTDRHQVQVFVSDAETGAAVPNAEVMVLRRYGNERATGATSALGLATLKLAETNQSSYVWVKRGTDVAFARAGDAYWSSSSRSNLAYVMTDRPLYKPGETVGLKVFLRSREAGPTEPLANEPITLIVRDPNGKDVAKTELTTNAFGTAFTSVPIAKTATLGAWYVTVTSNKTSYQQPSQSFRVEEFKPPEATVSVTAVGTASPGDPAKLKVTAKYYSGGPLAGAQGRAIVTVTSWSHQFGPWPDEERDDSAPSYSRHSRRRSWDDDDYYAGPQATYTLTFKTGSDGTAQLIVPSTPSGGADQQVTAQVFVTDASRREISGSGSAKLSSTQSFVDLRADHLLYRPGERVTIKLRAEDANGRPTSPNVLVRLSRISDPNTGALSTIAEKRTRVADGKGVVQLDADALGPVRAQVFDADAAQQTVPLASTDLWLTSDTKPIPPPGPNFQLLMDRGPVRAGQPLRLLVVTQEPGGHVWLTLEHDLIVSSQVVAMNGRTKYLELPVPAEATPNAWLTSSRFERSVPQYQQADVRVTGSDVALDVSVAFDRAVAEPGTSLPLKVVAKGATGESETAVSIVDEALFAIEPERQDFLTFFGRTQRSLSVRTHRSTDWRNLKRPPAPMPIVVADRQQGGEKAKDAAKPMPPAPEALAAPATAGPMKEEEAPRRSSAEKKSAAMDDASPIEESKQGQQPPVKTRSDFGSSAGWYPTLVGALGAPLSQTIKVTDSLTSWKAVATTVTKGPHLGRGSTTLRTAQPLMVRLQTPRFLIEGDEVVLSAVVESHLPKAGTVEVSIAAPGLKPLGVTKASLAVTPDQVARFDARFKVVELGDRTIRAQVKSGSAADAMELTIPALVHGSAQRQFFAGRLSDTVRFELDLPEKRKAALTRLELTLSPSVLAVMLDGLPYLAQYPYGCVEQTLSRFVPAVIARKAAKDAGLSAERLPPNLDDMVQKGLERLAGFQHGDGGWGWWRDDKTNLWMTAYVVYALGLAKDAGVAVDAAMVTRGRNHLLGNLGATLDQPDTHAFAVYALAQSGPVPKQVLTQAFERRTKLEPRGRALVALALLAANDARARVAVDNLDDVITAASSRPDAAVGTVTDAWSTSAAIEATAYTLMAMARWPDGAKYLGPLTDFLVLRRNGGKWRTTRDTAFAIYALSELAKREKSAAAQGAFTVVVNGKAVKTVKYAKGGLDVAPMLFADAEFRPGKNAVEVRRDGAGTGYWAATWDVFNQNDFIKGVGGDVKVSRSYTLLGKPSAEKASAPTEYGMPVESGVRLRVDLEITANKAVEFVMLEDLKPAGFEAVQQRSGREVCNYVCAHAELRTDRVALFLSDLPVGTTKLSYEVRAEVPGRFSALPARAEAMYAPEIQATADEMRFEVRDAPTTGVAAQ